MEFSLKKMRTQLTAVRIFLEDFFATLANVIYATLPLLVLLIVYSVIGIDSNSELVRIRSEGFRLTSWFDIFGGPDAMFVALVAFIDASRDSVKFVSLSPEKDDKDNLDALMILSVILVVLAAVILALSIAVDKHTIVLTASAYEWFRKSVSLTLLAALSFLFIHKLRLKRREKKLAKEAQAKACKPNCQCGGMNDSLK